MFSSSSTWASSIAFFGSFVVKSSTARFASPNRPTAFTLGAIVKTICPAVKLPGSILADLINAAIPGRGFVFMRSNPSLTRILFSSTSGTISAAPARATRSRYLRAISFFPILSPTAEASLKATPAPDKCLNG